MVVLAASIVTSSGKVLLSRQFLDMTRIRIEGLLSAFPKLLGANKRQYTYIETETIRYVYQPLEDLYLVLITNLGSNIVEDLEALRLMGRLVYDQVSPPVNEAAICGNAFSVLFAFDEVISLGYLESTSIEAVRAALEMDSMNETLHTLQVKRQQEIASEVAKEKERQFREQKKLAEQGVGGGEDSDAGAGELDNVKTTISVPAPESAPSSAAKKGVQMSTGKAMGLKLGQVDMVDKLVRKGEVARGGAKPSAAVVASASAGGASAPTTMAVTGAAHIRVEETINATLARDGSVSSLSVSGELQVTIGGSVNVSRIRLSCASAARWGHFAFQPNPKMLKSAFTDSRMLMLAEASKPFPSGGPRGLLRWRLSPSSVSAIDLPVRITLWPAGDTVSLELEAADGFTIENLSVEIPTGGAAYTSSSGSVGEVSHSGGMLRLLVPSLSGDDGPASMEFVFADDVPEDNFFPCNISFSSASSLSGIGVSDVQSFEDSSSLEFSVETLLVTGKFSVV